jgi:hypothetical protein
VSARVASNCWRADDLSAMMTTRKCGLFRSAGLARWNFTHCSWQLEVEFHLLLLFLLLFFDL